MKYIAGASPSGSFLDGNNIKNRHNHLIATTLRPMAFDIGAGSRGKRRRCFHLVRGNWSTTREPTLVARQRQANCTVFFCAHRKKVSLDLVFLFVRLVSICVKQYNFMSGIIVFH